MASNSWNKLSRPIPPIFVVENGDLNVYALIENAQNDLEAIDVNDGIYAAYDAKGRLLRLETQDNHVIISLAEYKPTHADELEQIVREFLRKIDDPIGDNPTYKFTSLVKYCRKFISYPQKVGLKELLFSLILVLLYVLYVVPLMIFWGTYRVVWSFWLGLRVRLLWYPKGKFLVFVYSNSPTWKNYTETNILPRIRPYAVIMNWSERSYWNYKWKPLKFQVFEHWAGISRYKSRGKIAWREKSDLGGMVGWGGEEFNPIAIVFVPWWKPKVLRFFKAFNDFKHGKKRVLRDLETKLFETLNEILHLQKL